MSGTPLCSSCRWSEPEITEDTGIPVLTCHRYPPVVVTDPAGGDLTRLFPQVDGDRDWCAEHTDHTDLTIHHVQGPEEDPPHER